MVASVQMVSRHSQSPSEDQTLSSSSTSSESHPTDTSDTDVEELMADIDDLEQEQGDNPDVQRLASHARSVRAWDAYITELSHPTRWRFAVAPPPPQCN